MFVRRVRALTRFLNISSRIGSFTFLHIPLYFLLCNVYLMREVSFIPCLIFSTNCVGDGFNEYVYM